MEYVSYIIDFPKKSILERQIKDTVENLYKNKETSTPPQPLPHKRHKISTGVRLLPSPQTETKALATVEVKDTMTINNVRIDENKETKEASVSFPKAINPIDKVMLSKIVEEILDKYAKEVSTKEKSKEKSVEKANNVELKAEKKYKSDPALS